MAAWGSGLRKYSILVSDLEMGDIIECVDMHCAYRDEVSLGSKYVVLKIIMLRFSREPAISIVCDDGVVRSQILGCHECRTFKKI